MTLHKESISNNPKVKWGALVLISAIGLALSGYGIATAVAWSNAVWYSFFTIGSLLFLAPISYALRRNALRHTLLEFALRSPVLLLFLYLVFFVLGSVIDLFYGTKLGQLWYYPRYDPEARALHNLIIGYPFAFLSVIPLYEISEFLWLSWIRTPKNRQTLLDKRSLQLLIISSSLFLMLLPILDKYIMLGYRIQEFCLIGSIAAIVLVDTVREMVQGRSFLKKCLSGDCRPVFAVLTASWLAALFHEIPNTFSQTWIYQNIPFLSARLFGVSIVVITVGWLFLTIVPVTVFRFLEILSNRPVRSGVLGLEKPAYLLGMPYLIFWLMVASLIVLMRFLLLAATEAHDDHSVLSFLMGVGIVWIASEIIWSYHALLSLRKVIGNIATPSKKSVVLRWYRNWLRFIYDSRTMAITGFFVACLFIPMIVLRKALCWTGSEIVCKFDSAYYIFTLFLGGMSQFPFYGMSFLALRLPEQPLENLNLFLSNRGDVRKFGRLFALVGTGGVGLILIAEIWLYIAPIKAIWLYVQLIIVGLSLGTLPWFLLTQYNIHKLMVRKKQRQLNTLSAELNQSIEFGLKSADEFQYRRIMILTSLKTQIEQLPEWPFDRRSIVELITAAGAAAALIPLIEFIKK